ncbi:MAG: phage/plasmid primase, P4 family [Terracidiphilus sp.]
MISAALDTLKEHQQFIVYRREPSKTRPGKIDKIPFDYRRAQNGNPLDRAIWLDADTAIQRAESCGNNYGVGFVLTAECKRFCLDIDNCLQPDNTWSPLAVQLCTMFLGAAVERSQSGRGLHIWGTYSGEMPSHSCKNTALGIELYHSGRFIALGQAESAIGNAATDCTLALLGLVVQYFRPDPAQAPAQEWTTVPCPDWRGPTDDDELIRRAMRSQSGAAAFGNGATFAELWNANEEALSRAYPDRVRPYDCSAADGGLAQRLAFWTGKDCERIRRLMRQSKLVREKWEREDYLRRTISGAVSRQIDVYGATASPVSPQSLPPALTVPEAALTGVETSLLQLGTQDSVAQIFASQMKGKMLYNHSRDKWLEWDGNRWQIEGTRKALNFARDLARSVNYEGKSSLGSTAFCAGVEQFAKADPVLSATGGEFDHDNYLLNTPHGTLDLRTGGLRKPNPEDRITLCTSVAPSIDGGAAFERFLAQITQGDRELSEFLQVSLGACLSGAVEAHWMLFWIGSGRNGKNTLGDLVLDAMGDYARKVLASTLMTKPQEGHPTEIANLQGIRLAVSSEINDGEHWNEARINEVTGDATLSARFMRGDFFTFKRTHKHLIYGNHRPQLRNVSNAVKSRIQIVPFNASFQGKEDFDLPRRLREDLGYVLGWLIEGHGKWCEAGKRLPSCKAVETESADYFAAQSTPEMWLAERVQILDPDTRPTSQCPKSGDLYRDYANWKKDRGEAPLSQTRWAELMRKFKKETSNGVRYRGLMLVPQGLNVPFPLSANAQLSRTN